MRPLALRLRRRTPSARLLYAAFPRDNPHALRLSPPHSHPRTASVCDHAGLSGKTVQIYLIVFVARLCSILKYEGYLPYDKSGDWLYQAVEVAAAAMAALALYLVFVQYRGTYEAEPDAFGAVGGVPSAAGIVVAIVPCMLLAAIFHPSLNGVWLTDVLWTFACYLETLALFPQLMVFSSKSGVKGKGTVAVEAHISHFVFAIAAGRMMHFVFWLSSFRELNDKYHETHVGRNIGWMILIAQVAHLVMLADYFYYYITAAMKGTQMVLPDRASAAFSNNV